MCLYTSGCACCALPQQVAMLTASTDKGLHFIAADRYTATRALCYAAEEIRRHRYDDIHHWIPEPNDGCLGM